MTKFIVVAGGVISGVGKGVASASIGKILKAYGYSVTAIKIDPYINCDAGTLRPTEHGEVWVNGLRVRRTRTWNYERFLGQAILKRNNITTGQIYKTIIEKERRGDFLGETVQYIPHVTNEIKNRLEAAAVGYDIALIEIGGTVGDYENVPFLFAVKNLERDHGRDSVVYILVTYMPIPSHIEEMKTKPTQLAIKLLEENGIHPDFILCRGRKALDEVRKKKLETYSNVASGSIISMPDVTGEGTQNTIYIIPLELEEEGLGTKLLNRLGLEAKNKPDWTEWKHAIDGITQPKETINVGIVGKYFDIGDYKLADSYISVNEALKHAGAACNARINLHWVDSKVLEGDKSLIGKRSESLTEL